MIDDRYDEVRCQFNNLFSKYILFPSITKIDILHPLYNNNNFEKESIFVYLIFMWESKMQLASIRSRT